VICAAVVTVIGKLLRKFRVRLKIFFYRFCRLSNADVKSIGLSFQNFRIMLNISTVLYQSTYKNMP